MKKIAVIIGFIVALGGSTTYVLLDTFVLQERQATVSSSLAPAAAAASTTPAAAEAPAATTVTTNTYQENDTTVYVSDIVLGKGQSIQTALAQNTYGKNITDATSTIASSVNATVAINGDFYGARTTGYVIRNGTLLRSDKESDDQEDVILWKDGTMTIVTEGDYTAQQLLDKGALQVLSFGPGLIIDSQISVTTGEEVGKAMASNPRTAIGYIDDNHYVMVVADGRTTESQGLNLLQLAEFMKSLGCTQAYNLDGGGSSTMYAAGKVVNKPTTNGSSIIERNVSDILYVK